MDRNKVTELIILDAVGCTNEKESEDLKKLQKTEENFPWNELAEFQKTVSLIPSVLSTEIPSSEIKKTFINKMNSVLATHANESETDKIGPGVQLISFDLPHDLSPKKTFEWKELSLNDSRVAETESYKEPENELPPDKQGFVPASKRRHVFDDDHFETHPVLSETHPEKILRPAKNFRKYALAASVIIIIGVFALGYHFLQINPEVVEVKKENITPVSSAPPVTEKIITDSLIAVNVEVDNQKVPQEEPQTKKLTNNDLLPQKTKIPKPPAPIELNMIEPAVDLPVGDTQESSQLINPPKEQIPEISEEPAYFIAVEEMPKPIGGIAEIQKKIEYPEIAKRVGLEGKVFVRAYVDETGIVTKAELVKGIGGGCDEAAIDAILKTRFSPGKQRGKPIKVQVTIPINFKL